MAADPLWHTYEMEYVHQKKLNFIQIGQKCTPLDQGLREEYGGYGNNN